MDGQLLVVAAQSRRVWQIGW